MQLSYEPETVLIPMGPFTMGSSEDHVAEVMAKYDDIDWYKKTEQPQCQITLPAYQIGKYPVTVGEYRVFVNSGGYTEQGYWTSAGLIWREKKKVTQPYYWDNEIWTGDDHLPVNYMSWYEALAYTRWLSEVTEKVYHLPTEAEWEKAARGTDGRIYPWGNERREGMCNSREEGIRHTTPVGQFSPQGDSPYGVVDMSGNVWEWCSSVWRERYQHGMGEDVESDEWRVMRGGTFRRGLDEARAAYRPRLKSYFRRDDFGFRVVCDISN